MTEAQDGKDRKDAKNAIRTLFREMIYKEDRALFQLITRWNDLELLEWERRQNMKNIPKDIKRELN